MEGKWVSSAKLAVFQVKRAGMQQQQVAPLWVLWVLHDSDSYGLITTVKAKDMCGWVDVFFWRWWWGVTGA